MEKKKAIARIHILGVNDEFWNLRHNCSEFESGIDPVRQDNAKEIRMKTCLPTDKESVVASYLITPDLDYKNLENNPNWDISFKRMIQIIKKTDRMGAILDNFTEKDFEDIAKLVLVTRETINDILESDEELCGERVCGALFTAVTSNSLLEKISKNMIDKDMSGSENILPISFIVYGVGSNIVTLSSKKGVDVELSLGIQSVEIIPADIKIN